MWVPSWGPRVDSKVIAPWEVPNWVAHVTYMGVMAPYIRKAWIRDLTVSYDGLSMMLIHTAAKLVTLRFHQALTTFYLTHADMALFLVWAPTDDYLDGYKLASHIASEAAYSDPPNGLDRIQSAAYQKDRVRRLVFQKWEREYYLDRTIEVFRECWCDTPPSAAYSYTITTHPSETHHPLWKEASKTKVEEDKLGRKITLPLYHRRTTSATFQLAVDHAFTSTYAKCFCPSDPPESLLCMCGNVLRSPSHIITTCPLHYQDRVC